MSEQQGHGQSTAVATLPAPDAAPKKRSTDRFTGSRKAAMLLVLLGEEASARLMRHLGEEEVQAISREIARSTNISAENAEDILEEFYQMVIARNYVIKGGIEYAKRMLMNAFGPEQATRMLDRLLQAIGQDSANFDALQKADPQQLAKFIQNEHPQTIALILSHLHSQQAAAMLMALPVDQHADVATRMANLDQISPEIVTRIATIIGQKMQELGEYSRESYGGVQAVAELFNHLDANTTKSILDTVESRDEVLGKSIRHLMFVFEDILKLDSQAVQEILSRVDRKLLTVALKGTSEPLRQHFIKVMSQRAAEMLREDMDALGPVKIRDVDEAQQQIIAVVRQLEAENVIQLAGGGGEEYVS
ncbi:MAG: flagellar motor switch protein FliG [Bryobacterales bacterium]|nr:flagellar motor switch protein FliG [Bryobacterales bacterium]